MYIVSIIRNKLSIDKVASHSRCFVGFNKFSRDSISYISDIEIFSDPYLPPQTLCTQGVKCHYSQSETKVDKGKKEGEYRDNVDSNKLLVGE